MARKHVGNNILAIDAVLGKVADDDVNKFDYVSASFLTRRVQVVVRDDVTADAAAYRDGNIVRVGGATVHIRYLWGERAQGAFVIQQNMISFTRNCISFPCNNSRQLHGEVGRS